MSCSALPELTPKELHTLSSAYTKIVTANEDKTVVLEPSNQKDKDLILIVLKASGQTPEKYPYLFEKIDAGGVSNSKGSNNVSIIDAGVDRNGKATALTFHTDAKGVLFSGASLMVLDGDKDELLAFGSNTDVHSGLMGNHTNANTARPAGKSIRTLGVNHMVNHDGTVTFIAVGGGSTVESDANPTVTDPRTTIQSHITDDYILIALGRDSAHIGNATDADYFYTENDNKIKPHLIVPFNGSCVVPYPIASGTLSANIQVTTTLYVDYGTTDAVTVGLDANYTPATKIQEGITVDVDTRTVSWQFNYDHLAYTETDSLVFSPAPANDKKSYFEFQFTIPLAAGAPQKTYTFTIYSYDSAALSQPFSSSTVGKQIPRLQFWWHCLARGTQVMLADGHSQINIEDIDNASRVLTGSHGASLGIEATTLGHHKATAKQTGLQAVYRLCTKDGKELITTGAHPIMTPTGAIMACHLNTGDAVLVSEGISSVVACEPIDYDATFHNLKLGNVEDRAKMGQHPVNSFYANGILVGDHIALHNQADRQRYDLDYILPRIDSAFHTDYASAVRDRKY